MQNPNLQLLLMRLLSAASEVGKQHGSWTRAEPIIFLEVTPQTGNSHTLTLSPPPPRLLVAV